MGFRTATGRTLGSVVGVAVLALATLGASGAPAARTTATAAVPVRFERLAGFAAPGTPARYDKVGVLETGPSSAKNILVLVPGTSASAAYFEPLAKDIVRKTPGWQVWAVERRENLLEDHSMLNRAKQGKATPQQLFDYYLGYITNPAVKQHFQLIPDSQVAFARQWGMNVEIEDLHQVVQLAKHQGGRVVLGGHSLGGSITTAYATWDFNGQAGAKDLSGLVFIDGASSPTPVSTQAATLSLQGLQTGSPWLAFGGITAPYAGLFNAVSSTLVHNAPNAPSILASFAPLPKNLKAPVPVSNVGGYGYALDTKTSPMGLTAAQGHLGQLAATGDPRGWDPTGALTPIQRFADMFSGTGLQSLDGTAWYHPMRLTIDSGAVADGNANPTQAILDVHATHGHDLPKGLRIYAFGAALGGQRVLDATTALADQSQIPSSQLTLINRQSTYAHNDPAGASPNNEFLANLVPFLNRVAR
jgi:pimeloyl-ACP methyl ester carboxylesterase